VRPGLGTTDPPSRFSLFMLRWEWFRIYFESGLVKLLSGDQHWRNLTAMDEYYQNGPLPSWLGWYVQQLPHWYHAGTVIITFAVELVIVWAVFLPRRFRVACFVVVTALQIGIIATANYGFLNYLVLVLGVLLLDDRVLARLGLRSVPSAVGVSLADVGPVGAGGQVPVDLAGIVARHVLADVGLLHPGTAPAGAVVAGRVHAERAEHRPVEAAETVADVRLSGGHFLQAP